MKSAVWLNTKMLAHTFTFFIYMKMRLASQFEQNAQAEKEIHSCRYYFYVLFNKADTQQQRFWCARFIHLPARRTPGMNTLGKVTFGSSLKIKCWLSADAGNKGNGVESEGGKTRTLVCACRVRELYKGWEWAGAENRACISDFNTLSLETEKLQSACKQILKREPLHVWGPTDL
jgi:hypothetical protein